MTQLMMTIRCKAEFEIHVCVQINVYNTCNIAGLLTLLFRARSGAPLSSCEHEEVLIGLVAYLRLNVYRRTVRFPGKINTD